MALLDAYPLTSYACRDTTAIEPLTNSSTRNVFFAAMLNNPLQLCPTNWPCEKSPIQHHRHAYATLPIACNTEQDISWLHFLAVVTISSWQHMVSYTYSLNWYFNRMWTWIEYHPSLMISLETSGLDNTLWRFSKIERKRLRFYKRILEKTILISVSS